MKKRRRHHKGPRRHHFRPVRLSFFLWVILCISGCGGDEDSLRENVPVNFVSAHPPEWSELYASSTITVTFDGKPEDVTVSGGTVTVGGKTALITGAFPQGFLALRITWADGTQVLNYIVISPDCCPPEIVGGTVSDGDKDVDPEAINSDGKIEIEFSEEKTGYIALETEAGEDVGWIGKVVGNKAILELVKGREIKNETTYVIQGTVTDAAGNSIDVSITFVTRGKA